MSNAATRDDIRTKHGCMFIEPIIGKTGSRYNTHNTLDIPTIQYYTINTMNVGCIFSIGMFSRKTGSLLYNQYNTILSIYPLYNIQYNTLDIPSIQYNECWMYILYRNVFKKNRESTIQSIQYNTLDISSIQYTIQYSRYTLYTIQ